MVQHRLLLIVLFLLIDGCVSPQTDFLRERSAVIGMPWEDLIDARGMPTSGHEVEGGAVLVWYEKETVVSGVGAFADPICCDIGAPAGGLINWCERIFTIVDDVVVDFQRRGNAC